MNLPEELVSQFARITKDDSKPTKTEKTVNGTVVSYNGKKYVRFDGSELLTPVESTTNIEDTERVIVTIKNHTATVTGNITSPSARNVEVSKVAGAVNSFIYHDSINGLQIGDKSSGSWAGFRTQLLYNALNILNAIGDVVASYGEKLIELGKNATDAVIKLCGGKGQIEYVTDEDTSDEYLQITADKLRLKSDSMSSLYSTYTDNSTRWEKSATNVSTTKVHAYASECIEPTLSDMLEGWNISEFTLNSGSIDLTTPGPITLNGSEVKDSFGQFDSVIEGSSGIWSYKQWFNGCAELWGTYEVSNISCTTALGGLYRTALLTIDKFPFAVLEPKLTASYESDGYGAFLWATTETTSTRPPSYYLIRPTTATIANGRITFHVIGRWK